MKIVGNKIKEYRKMKKMTQIDLAAYCGVCRETIVYIEHNRYTPSYTLALDIAECLNIPASELFIVQSDHITGKDIQTGEEEKLKGIKNSIVKAVKYVESMFGRGVKDGISLL